MKTINTRNLLLLLFVAMTITLSSCNDDNHPYNDPRNPAPRDDYSVMLLLVDSNGKNILSPNSVGAQYDYRAIYNDCSVELCSPLLDDSEFVVKAPYVAYNDEKKIPYLYIRSCHFLKDGEARHYTAEHTIYSNYIFRDMKPHHIKVVHEPIFLRQDTVYVDGVACPSVQRPEVTLSFFYATYVVPWD